MRDPYAQDKWTAFTVSVYAPTWERPYPSVLVSVANGGGKVLFRCASVADARQMVVIPETYLERLKEAEGKAIEAADQIERDMRTALKARDLAPGGRLVRTDTGEVIAEAERIVRGDRAGQAGDSEPTGRA